MAKVEARNRSSATDDDKLKDAKDLYKATPNPSTGKKIAFAYEHFDSNDNDTMVLEKPIGRKAEKAKRKRTDSDKGFDDYLAKKLQYIQASHEQD
ncbi:hypothetical protein SO802_033054 [Lithocarpus litseifolius]|uniref:Uncharacterized protein n=1 Tax=Lithocarpus litseifolius TaxID=425828 RepID=A0AAW2BC34_9ROSI